MTSEISQQSSKQLGSVQSPFSYPKAHLVLQDGTVFSCGAIGELHEVKMAEVVFFTGMSGYQEVMTDPSYFGQIITFTYPHIGNYGINKEDYESRKIWSSGLVVRDYVEEYSNYRAVASLNDWLIKNKTIGLVGLDTRKLTKHIRSHGSMPGAFGVAPVEKLQETLKNTEAFDRNLVEEVTTDKPYTAGKGSKTIVAYDFGIKNSIVDRLKELGKVIVVPAKTTAKEVLEHKPDGVFLSNGPGDPEDVESAQEQLKELVGKVPIFGICLGHQLLCLALGGKTIKLKFGHHGANHPIMNKLTGEVEITSQNHNYAVKAGSLKPNIVSHVNLNDGVIEGVRDETRNIMSVQYHPEAGPGPHDSYYLFSEFNKMMNDAKA